MCINKYGADYELEAAELNAGGALQMLVENCCPVML